MEEDKTIKRKKTIKLLYKILNTTLIGLLIIVAGFFVTYIASKKIAQSKGENPPFGLYTVISPSMTPNIDVYDVVFVEKTNEEELKVDDVITFYSTNEFFGNTPITHRIVEILDIPNNGTMYRVKGDANESADTEKVIPKNIVGKVLFKIPKLGKIQFFLASKKGWLLAIIIPSVIILVYDIFKLIKLINIKNKLNNYGPNSLT